MNGVCDCCVRCNFDLTFHVWSSIQTVTLHSDGYRVSHLVHHGANRFLLFRYLVKVNSDVHHYFCSGALFTEREAGVFFLYTVCNSNVIFTEEFCQDTVVSLAALVSSSKQNL